MLPAPALQKIRAFCKYYFRKITKYSQQNKNLLNSASSDDFYLPQFLAIKNLSLQIHSGEVLGVIGKNGCGKSTLLALIAGVLTPNNGSISVNGSVASILELGAGFNVDFTGRENLSIAAALRGMGPASENETKEIIEFAELGEFLDYPLRTYSSGMAMRLAFASAIIGKPEILIIDEALAVGDERFQRKCFAKIKSLNDQGCTIVFVSHSSQQILNLCTRVILLDEGVLIANGDPGSIVKKYQALLKHDKTIERQPTINQRVVPLSTSESPSNDALQHYNQDKFDQNLVSSTKIKLGSDSVEIFDVVILDTDDCATNKLVGNQQYTLRYRVKFFEDAQSVRFGFSVTTIDGLVLGGGITAKSETRRVQKVEATTILTVEFKFYCRLNPGLYYLTLGVRSGEEIIAQSIDETCFKVLEKFESQTNGLVNFSVEASLAPYKE